MSKSVHTFSLSAIKLSMTAIITYQILLFALIFIKPELDPSWQPISEYTIGRFGWLMVLAFIISATSYFLLFLALKSHIRTVLGRIGLGLLLICALGTLGAGIFTTDPVQTPQNALSATGSLHAVSAGAALALLPVAALLVSIGLARNQAWTRARKVLLWTAGLPLVGLVAFLITMGIVAPAGSDNIPQYGPGVNIGWPNRLLLLVYMAWIINLGWRAVKILKPSERA